MARRVAGQRDGRHSCHCLALAHRAHAVTIRRRRDGRLGDVAADALVLAACFVAVEPKSRFCLVQDELRVRINRVSGRIDEAIGMIGMDVGEKDGGDLLRSNAEVRRFSASLPSSGPML